MTSVRGKLSHFNAIANLHGAIKANLAVGQKFTLGCSQPYVMMVKLEREFPNAKVSVGKDYVIVERK